MIDIDEIMEMIYWDSSTEVQEAGILLGSQVETIGVFMQPVIRGKHPKGLWGNSAKILSAKSDEDLELYSYDLLEWLQDLNHPGAFDILHRLQNFRRCEHLSSMVKLCVENAVLCKEELWVRNMAELLSNNELRILLSEETINTMLFYKALFEQD